jgi:hypothetical protein
MQLERGKCAHCHSGATTMSSGRRLEGHVHARPPASDSNTAVDNRSEMVARVRWVAVRWQSLVAVALVAAIVIQNARSSSGDIAWQAVALSSVFLALLCLSPAAFAWTPRSYRRGAAVVALLLTIAAVGGITTGGLYAVPAAIVAWLTTVPTRQPHIDYRHIRGIHRHAEGSGRRLVRRAGTPPTCR